MAQKKQEGKTDLALEFVGILPVIKIAVSDNRDSRPKSGKMLFFIAPVHTGSV